MTNDLKQVRDALAQWVSATGGQYDPVKERVTEQALATLDRMIAGRVDVSGIKSIVCQLRNCFSDDGAEYGECLLNELFALVAQPSGDVAAALGEMETWEYFTDGAYWDMCAVRPVGDKDFNSLNLFHVSNLKEGERLASLLNKLTEKPPQPDVSELLVALKRVRQHITDPYNFGYEAMIGAVKLCVDEAIARAEQKGGE